MDSLSEIDAGHKLRQAQAIAYRVAAKARKKKHWSQVANLQLDRLRKDWHEQQHPRDNAGKFGSGGPSADASAKLASNRATSPAMPATVEGMHVKARQIADSYASKGAALLAKYAAPARWLKTKTAQVKEQLTERYGAKGAASIIAAGGASDTGDTVGGARSSVAAGLGAPRARHVHFCVATGHG